MMFASLGYAGATASATTWLTDLAPLVIFLVGVPLALSVADLLFSLIGAVRGMSADRPHVGKGV